MMWEKELKGRRAIGAIAVLSLLVAGAPLRAENAEESIGVSAPNGGTSALPVTRLVVPRIAYPATRNEGLVDQAFGERVADPFRWLEADPRKDADVASWVARQNAVSADYLAKLPGRERFAARIRNLYDFERYGLPRKAGSRYFYTRNSGLQNQSALWVRKDVAGEQRLLLDPNTWSADGSLALAQWEPSPSGKFLAFAEQEAGSDWRTLRVVEVATGRVLDERLANAHDTDIAWIGDEGFFYSRFPAPRAGDDPRAPRFDKAVWFHRIGTAQDEDEQVFATPDHPEWSHKAQVTSDGRWVVIVSEVSTDKRNAINLIRVDGRLPGRWNVVPLVPEIADHWRMVAGIGDKLWFLTDRDAPEFHLVSIDLTRTGEGWKVVVPQRANKLEGARMIGDRFLLSYLQGGQSVAVMADRKGRPGKAITVNGIGTASGFGGRPGDAETFYQFSSFATPPAICPPSAPMAQI